MDIEVNSVSYYRIVEYGIYMDGYFMLNPYLDLSRNIFNLNSEFFR